MAKRQETVLQGTAPLLLARLAEVEVDDNWVESRRRLTAFLTWLLALPGVFLLFAFPPLGILLLIGAVASGIVWNGYRARDLDDERLHLVHQVVNTLRQDLSEKTPARVTVRHGDCFRYGLISDQRTVAGVRYSAHEDSWLEMRGRLRDGSALRVEVCEEAKRKARPKRKYTKIKDRIRETVSVAVRVPPEEYPRLAELQRHLDPGRLQQGAGLQLCGLQVAPPVVRLSAATGVRLRQVLRTGTSEMATEHRLTAQKLLALLLFLYAGLSHCRAPAQPQARPGAAPAGNQPAA